MAGHIITPSFPRQDPTVRAHAELRAFWPERASACGYLVFRVSGISYEALHEHIQRGELNREFLELVIEERSP